MKSSTRLMALLLATTWLAGCASTQSSSSSSTSMPSPTASPSPMPSMPSPSTSPASRPSPPSPSSPSSSSRSSSSSSSSSSPGNPGPTGAPTPGTTPGTTPPGGTESTAAAGPGGEGELEVLEPEPLEDLASEDPTWEQADAGGGAEGGGEEGGGGASGGDEGGTEPAGSQAGGPAGQPGVAGGVRVATPDGLPGGGGEGLDQELNRSLEIFDEEMQRTITILASARGGGEGDPGGGLDAESGEPGDPLDQTGQGSGLILVDGDPSKLPGASEADGETDGEQGTEIARSGNRRGLPGGGSSRNEAYPRIPADVGDGSDDDVVARQIREAALSESDPVLREKLWQEYRNYKKSIK